MSRPQLDPEVLDKARDALAQLAETSTTRFDTSIATPEGDVALVAYWVGEIARVDVKAARR